MKNYIPSRWILYLLFLCSLAAEVNGQAIPDLHIVCPDYGLSQMFISGNKITGLSEIEFQRKLDTDPAWPAVWESGGMYGPGTFEFNDPFILAQDVKYLYRVRERIASGAVSPPSAPRMNQLSVFWPLCSTLDCMSEAIPAADLKSLIVGFNQPRGYSTSSGGVVNLIHDAIDINGDPSIGNENVYSPVGGYIEAINPHPEFGITQYSVLITIRNNNANERVAINHLSTVVGGTIGGNVPGQSIYPGIYIAQIDDQKWNTENSHIDLSYGRNGPSGIEIIDPFLLFHNFGSVPDYEDPQNQAPSLRNLDSNIPWLEETIRFKVDHGSGTTTPPYLYFEDEPGGIPNIHGPVDIIAEASDLQSTLHDSGQSPKRIGYFIEYFDSGIWDDEVKTAANPYILIDNEMGKIPSNIEHTSMLVDVVPGQNAIEPEYHQNIIINPGAPVDDQNSWYHLNFNYIVTNTNGEDGSVEHLNALEFWGTNAKTGLFGQSENGSTEMIYYEEARHPDEAYFQDGSYRINIVFGDYIHQNELVQKEVVVDNFVPYIRNVQIFSDGTEISNKGWIPVPVGDPNYNPNGPLKFEGTGTGHAHMDKPFTIIATLSEPVPHLDISFTDNDEFGAPSSYNVSVDQRTHTYVYNEFPEEEINATQKITFSNPAAAPNQRIQNMHSINGGASPNGPMNPDQVYILRKEPYQLEDMYINNNSNPPNVGTDQSYEIHFDGCVMDDEFNNDDQNEFAGFQQNLMTGCLLAYFTCASNDGFIVNFADESIGSIVEWQWDFGDGTTLSGNEDVQHPEHEYETAGSYQVSLVVCDGESNCTEAYTKTVVINGDNLTAYIDGPGSADVGESISLYGDATGGTEPYILYEWDFGTGAASNDHYEQNPDVSYSTSGVKTVTLTVTDDDLNTASTSFTISVIGTPIEADFDWWPESPNVFPPTAFSSSVYNNIGTTTYEWSVPSGPATADPMSPTLASTYIEFPQSGAYTVSLKVCDQNGCVTVNKQINIGGIEADFVGDPSGVISSGTEVDFDPIAPFQPGYSYLWDFGNGYAYQHDPPNLVLYQGAGCYTVSLTVTDQIGNSVTETKNCYINIPQPEFNLSGMSVQGYCVGDDPYIVASFTGGQQKITDIPKIPSTEEFPTSCWGEFLYYHGYLLSAKTMDNQPLYDFFQNDNYPCSFINMDHPALDVLDDNIPFTFKCIAHAEDYSVPNNQVTEEYIFTLYPDLTIHVDQVRTACPDTEISLLDVPAVTGGKPPYTFHWDNTANFVAGYDQNSPNPVVLVPEEGVIETYTVEVMDSQNSCMVLKSFQLEPAKLNADAGGPTILSCVGQSVATLGGSSTATGGSGQYSYLWSPLNNINNANVANPTVVGSMDGDMVFTVLVTDENGCMATDEVTVEASESSVVADAGLDRIGAEDAICFGSEATLGGSPTGTGSDLIGNLAYQWTSDLNNEYSSTLSNPTIGENETTTEGIYTYNLIVYDDGNGCFDEQEVMIQVRPDWDKVGFATDGIQETCLGEENGGPAFFSNDNYIVENLPFGATAPFTYTWSPASQVVPNDVVSPAPIFTPSALNPSAMVLVEDANGCTKEYESIAWVFYDGKPSVELSLAEGQELCEGNLICIDIVADLNASGSSANPPQSTTAEWVRLPTAEQPHHGEIFLVHDPNTNLYLGELCLLYETPGVKEIIIDDIHTPCGEAVNAIQFTVDESEAVEGDMARCNNGAGEIPDNDYKAINIVAADGCYGTIKPKGEVRFIAGESVTLYPGTFRAHIGCYFKAMITPGCFVEEPPMVVGETNEDKIKKSELDIHVQKSVNSGSNSLINLSLVPNPFSEQVTISYTIDQSQTEPVTLRVIDLTGKTIDVLIDQSPQPSGSYTYEYRADQLVPGIYFCELIAGTNSTIKKMIKIQ